ncbi:MAG: aminopeptidase [Lachnospiraceae bacterium]|jgi:aspartyl aminopeptidase|nr:aminopeptidase [Lachnospiraceae bacterium]
MTEEKTAAKLRQEELFLKKQNGYDKIDEASIVAMDEYCDGYKKFLDNAKTEREAVKAAVSLAEEKGFVPFRRYMSLKPGDRVYVSNRGQSLMLAVIGTRPLDEGINIGAAHIDSPRLDLKPYPLFEDGDFALLKTHYYGGIRKYQWLSVPLELRGTVIRKDGTKTEVTLGGEPGDPFLVIPDLLPHLASAQSEKPLGKAVDPEAMNIFLGSRPYPDKEVSERFKLAALDLLNQKYGITEEDFLSAELCAVPAYSACDIGLDRSMIGAYGQDDRVCGYASLKGLFDAEAPEKTAVCVLADKEEIGSMGVSGMQSQAFDTFIADLCSCLDAHLRTCYENSFCLSADVNACYDPNYADVYDKRNSSFINQGVTLCKYTGSRGKSGASDASAEVMGYARKVFHHADVLWNVSELGKIEAGGGGTLALYMANRNIDTVDAGVPVLGMHAPFEVTGKLDCYMMYLAMKAVYEAPVAI